MDRKEMLNKLTVELTENGKLIEAGWVGLQLVALPESASYTQVTEMRKAFFAGAAHLFSSIMNILEPDAEPTDNDLKRLTLINDELQAFQKELMESLQ